MYLLATRPSGHGQVKDRAAGGSNVKPRRQVYDKHCGAACSVSGSIGPLLSTHVSREYYKAYSHESGVAVRRAVIIQLGRFCIVALSVAAWLCNSIEQHITIAAHLAYRVQ
jgi:hypothetical protein